MQTNVARKPEAAATQLVGQRLGVPFHDNRPESNLGGVHQPTLPAAWRVSTVVRQESCQSVALQ